MSRLLRINKQDIDIDEATAIGITLQSYDIKEPNKRKVNITNSFTIPLTANNNKIFGYPSNINSNDKSIYAPLTADYWDSGYKIIENSLVRVDEVSDRISLSLYQKLDLWDKLKLITWPEFAKEYIEWVQPQLYQNYSQLIYDSIYASGGLFLPCWLGQISTQLNEDKTYYIEDIANLWIQYKESNGGHFAIYAVDVFRFIEYKYNVKFLTNGLSFSGNIFSDEYVKSIYTPIRSLSVKVQYNSETGIKEGFKLDFIGNEFLPLEVGDKTDKTLHDFVTSFFQIFNVIVDYVGDEIRLARWDNLIDQPPIKWTDKLDNKTIKFKPSISGYTQNNQIKFASVFEGGGENLNGKIIKCLNKNIDIKSDLFSIDANIPNFAQSYGGIIPNLSDAKTFETFQFFISAYESVGVKAQTTANIATHFDDGITKDTALNYMQMPSAFSIENEYNLLSKVLEYPEYREVSCWLTINDIINLRFYAQYYFQQLGGSYFINKIAGFNPSKSLVATKIELIKVSDKSPTTPPNLEYYVDGVENGFTDGENDLFY